MLQNPVVEIEGGQIKANGKIHSLTARVRHRYSHCYKDGNSFPPLKSFNKVRVLPKTHVSAQNSCL